jgi:hypothetical protein
LLLFRQIDTGEVEVPQGIFQQFLLRGIEPLLLFRDLLVGIAECLVLSQLGGVVAEFGQTGVVGDPEFVVVDHRIHVAHRGPGAAQSVVQYLQGFNQVFPAVFLL